ncbi:MAG: Eco57I restriction-modification methylase domain-containing protein, partial [Patescibacteria group bacterium]
DFAKKLMGQIVFLYFLQKKGWLGVAKGQDWGSGPHDFLRRLANDEYGKYNNFFNDILEPLFYDTLATDRGHEAWCNTFKCRMPFLNGGLFEPLGGYDWKKIDIILPNRLFNNTEYVEEGITGTGVLDVFDRYNFTVNEAEPLEKEVAIDPEMLGKVFENLIEDNRRKGLGAYYTPREIVHYMCQESLINYLDTALNPQPVIASEAKQSLQHNSEIASSQTPLLAMTPPEPERVPREDIETFVHLGDQAAFYEAARMSGTKSYKLHLPKSIEKHARLIDEKLTDITVCDPAVGSGAFLVGMMTEIVRCRAALTAYFNDIHERTPYHFKRHAIQNCLYGVDVDLGAVEIAKLRLWLSLVVDEEDVKQIKPLPNLDYKIVAGDSLISLPFKSRKLSAIEKLKLEFFDETDHDKKAKLKIQIDRQLRETFAASKKSLGYEVHFDFHVFFSEVFERKQGFDVVIANPPYVSAIEFCATHSDAERKLLNKSFKSAKGAYDIYVPFMERGLQLLAKHGVLTFINPNKYLSAKYAQALRECILANATLVKLVDVSGILVFEQAAVYPVVSIMLKSPMALERVRRVIPRLRKAQLFDLRNFLETSVSQELLRVLPEYIWGFLLSTSIELLLKLTKGTSMLSDVAKINASSTAGEADDYGRHIEDRPSKDSMKVVNTGTIERFHSLWGKTEFTHARQKFLTPYLPMNKARVNDRRRELYESQKLIFAKMAKSCEAFYDVEGEYASINTNCLYGMKDGTPLGFMAGYCNSKLFMFFYDQYFGSLRMSGGYYQFQSPQLRVLPFKNPGKSTYRCVCELVEKILAAKKRDQGADTTAWEREIDRLVYELYGLTEDEIAIVEAK